MRRAASPAPWARRGLARVRIDVGEPRERAISLATCVGGRRSADGSAVVQKIVAAVQRSHGWSCAAESAHAGHGGDRACWRDSLAARGDLTRAVRRDPIRAFRRVGPMSVTCAGGSVLERFPDVGEGSGKGFTTGGRVWEKGFGALKRLRKVLLGEKLSAESATPDRGS